MADQRARVPSSDGKNASSRNSWAVTSIGVPIVETTEKNESSASSTSKRRSTTGEEPCEEVHGTVVGALQVPRAIHDDGGKGIVLGEH
jgi:hypothetical protein